MGAGGDHCSIEFANRFSHRIMVECDFPKERPVARKPSPSVRTLMAEDTSVEAVRNRAMGVPVRSLNCLPQALHRYFWTEV